MCRSILTILAPHVTNGLKFVLTFPIPIIDNLPLWRLLEYANYADRLGQPNSSLVESFKATEIKKWRGGLNKAISDYNTEIG